MTTAFVLTGGGSLGAVQVGMLQALSLRAVQPDFLVGTSAGAMNAAWVASHGTSQGSLDALATVWAGLRRADLFPFDLRLAIRGLLGLRPALTSTTGLRHLVASHTSVENLEESRIPVHLVATDLVSGCTVPISGGSVVDGVLASAAIPGLLPPVPYDDRSLIDGAFALDNGLRLAVELGAADIYVLPAGTACALPAPPRSAVGAALHALTLLLQQQLTREVRDLAAAATIKVVPPLCPLSVAATDFTRATELVDRARAASLDWIDAGNLDLPDPARFLSVHDHRVTNRRPSA